MALNGTPSGERKHIVLIGMRNAGKSSLMNSIIGQELAVVSPVKGTTTDPVRKAIGCSHSGWRGTVQEMGRATVQAMEEHYGCRPENIRAAVGPSICRDCYEVSADVAEEFLRLFSQSRYGFVDPERILFSKGGGKYQLDLWRANEAVLLAAGIRREHLFVTDICTCCNPDYLFSHRASGGRRGNFGAFIMLKE